MRSNIEIEDPPLDILVGPFMPEDERSMVCVTIELVDSGNNLIGYKLLVSFPVIAVPGAGRSKDESTVRDKGLRTHLWAHCSSSRA